jgi:hypothetical protein
MQYVLLTNSIVSLSFEKVPVAIHLVPIRYSGLISTGTEQAKPKADSGSLKVVIVPPEK